MTVNSEEYIQRAAKMLRSARHAVVLTGAGISTPSGIPDFRSPGTGAWVNLDLMDVVSLTSFHRNPEQFYAWLRPLAIKMAVAKPNPAHYALAELEKTGILHAVLTQNIDGLHQKAGSRNVIELHGSLDTLSCLACHLTFSSDACYPDFIDKNVIPHCTACGAILKPDIVFYEETLPENAWLTALEFAEQADVFLAAGTSLEVTPVSGLPLYALENGAKLIILNYSTTYLDKQATMSIKDNVAVVLPEIVRAILKES
ncbi:MAG TPA: NAD-dependent deacylase [Longilinea sp.]|nr:NAD-dependent deacylase [Longilinea sp.]